MAGRRIGHVNLAADILHIEGDESGGANRRRRRERAGGSVVFAVKVTVEHIDAAGSGAVGGEQHRLRLIDREPGEARARDGRLRA